MLLVKKIKSQKKEILKTVKGTRDILPEEARVLRKIEEKARGVAEYYGFKPIQTPHLEQTELFTASLGEATEMVEKQMYSFHTRGGDYLTLRPEGTAPIMRAYLEHGMKTWPQPVMLYYHGSFFRHESPQKGRWREFGQFGLEILGDASPVSDAIIIRVSTLILEEIGFKNIIVHINTLGDKECRGVYRKELVQYLRRKVNYLCPDCKKRLKKNPLRVLDCKNEECREIKEGAPQMIEYACADCRAHFKDVLEFLDELKIPYFLNHFLVRGLDYYSRTVFEFMPSDERDQKTSHLSLGGGGRYDYLAAALSSKNIPAAGAALGMDRITELAKELGISPLRKKEPKLFLIQLGDYAKRKSLSLVEDFRKANVPLAMSFSRDSIASQLKIAVKSGATLVLIIGQKEAYDETIIVRDIETRIQETVPLNDLLNFIKAKLKK
ncbi:MAG: histidine--tRNA ligase [Patescibacteria group bacterium]